jgi:cystathionine beta-lyase
VRAGIRGASLASSRHRRIAIAEALEILQNHPIAGRGRRGDRIRVVNGMTDRRSDSRFERTGDRRRTESVKWNYYPEDVLPMWVADMDFRCANPVVEALRARVEHGIFGYPKEPEELRDVIVERLRRRFDWTIEAESIVFVPNVYVGFHLAAHAVTRSGDGVLITPPIYFPILSVPKNANLRGQLTELLCSDGLRYEIDFDDLERTIDGRSRLFILCNPHNPVGRVYKQSELERLAEICETHDLIICSDEIHSDFVFEGYRHVPIAALSPEIDRRTITLMSPAKSFNVAGIPFAFAVISDPKLRERYENATMGLVPGPGVMGYTAALAAFREGDEWLDGLATYLQANRDVAAEFVRERLPGVAMTPLEGTYLAWLDLRNVGIDGSPYEFLLDRARLGTVDGAMFGTGGEGFVRLNLACPRETLADGLERIERSLESRRI